MRRDDILGNVGFDIDIDVGVDVDVDVTWEEFFCHLRGIFPVMHGTEKIGRSGGRLL